MTLERLQSLQSALTLLETEIAGCNSKERECIDKAREFNALGRQVRNDRTAIEAKAEPIRKEMAEIATELKRQQAEKAKAEAEATAKARAEAGAKAKAEAAKSELERLEARLAELKAQG